jgi:exosortase
MNSVADETRTGKPGRSVAMPKHIGLLLKIATVVALLWLLFWSVLVNMAHDWWIEPAWSQGMLLPPLAIYIAWLNWKKTSGIAVMPDPRGLLITGFACCVFIAGRLASEFFLTRIAFVILLAGLVWTFWGIGRLRSLGFPFLLLATMVPLPVIFYNAIAAPLQLFASDFATQIVQALGVTVFRDGNIIQLAGVSLGVAEACSGLNSLSALFVAGILLGFLTCTRTVSRVAIVAIAIPMAIGVNVLRVAGTAIIADHNQELAMGFYHAFSGWLVFVAGFGLLYACAKGLHAILDSR